METFATVNDVIALTGKSYTHAEEERITALLPLVCDALRYEATKRGYDLDEMAEDASFESVLKLVTVDVVARAMRQSYEGEPMSQESQSALGYTWSGTYATPGGGVANAIMRNDLKRLGLLRQRYGAVEFYETTRNHGHAVCKSTNR